MVTVPPALTEHLPVTPLRPPALQRMSIEVTAVTGVLLIGLRAQVKPCLVVSQGSPNTTEGDISDQRH